MVKRCSICILPETVPNIEFDMKGVCNYCSEYNKNDGRRAINYEEKGKIFEVLMENAIRKRKENSLKYDALVPISGGRDSSYIAHKLSEKMKILCVNYENPFSSEQAKKNIEKVIKANNSDIISFNYKNGQHEKSFRNNLKAWIKKPELRSMGLLCLACKPMYLEFFKIAEENHIGLIVDGSNPNEVTTFKIESRVGAGVKRYFKIRAMINMGREICKNYSYLKPCNFLPGIKTLMSLDGNTFYLKYKFPKVMKVGYFYFHPYDEKMIGETLRKIGWEKASENRSPWRFDCEIDSLKNYLFKKIIGATEKDDLFSKNIRNGLMTREEAISRLEESEVNIDIVRRVLERIQMGLSDLEGIEKIG